MIQTRHAVITDEMIQQVKKRLGVEYTPGEPFYNTQATRDAIRHFADGIGDLNPLHRKEEYALKTRWHSLIAPPAFYYSVFPVGRSVGLPGVHGWFAGGDWTYYRPLYVDEFLTPYVKFIDMVEKKSRHARRIFLQYSQVIFKTRNGDVPARAIGWVARAERGAAGEHGTRKHSYIQAADYSKEEMDRIVKAALEEKVRGAEPRYWEDVQVGDELDTIVRGPLTMRDIYGWMMGRGSPFMKAHGLFFQWRERNPRAVMTDSATGEVDVPELVHMQDTRAREIGVVGAYDYGAQRLSWLFNLVTNWQSDEGFLWKLYGEIRGFNVVGDTSWLKGKVTRKYEEGGVRLVDLELSCENQRGEITAPGRASVSLPSRVHGPAGLPSSVDAS
ncbi:MAG: MaoC family dehydratase N-terminal domain-containing protein [Chloroflexi bacterium]|nr:MaoC family dehydratase N-terminal domain-containing protein [Chloroflexota bacterium]